jgi:hypothetical protein
MQPKTNDVKYDTKHSRLSNYLVPRSRVLIEKPPVAPLLKNFPVFYEPENLFLSSQELSTSPYPEPDEYSP